MENKRKKNNYYLVVYFNKRNKLPLCKWRNYAGLWFESTENKKQSINDTMQIGNMKFKPNSQKSFFDFNAFSRKYIVCWVPVSNIENTVENQRKFYYNHVINNQGGNFACTLENEGYLDLFPFGPLENIQRYEFTMRNDAWYTSIEYKEPMLGERRYINVGTFKETKVFIPKTFKIVKKWGILNEYHIQWVPAESYTPIKDRDTKGIGQSLKNYVKDMLIGSPLGKDITDSDINKKIKSILKEKQDCSIRNQRPVR